MFRNSTYISHRSTLYVWKLFIYGLPQYVDYVKNVVNRGDIIITTIIITEGFL